MFNFFVENILSTFTQDFTEKDFKNPQIPVRECSKIQYILVWSGRIYCVWKSTERSLH